MKITVIPDDHLIMVDGAALIFKFEVPANLHALQWEDDCGHIELRGTGENHALRSGDFADQVKPYLDAWREEKNRLERLANQPPAPPEARAAKLRQIDEETSDAILAGFEYELDGVSYHFSYDGFDQQNFADAANAAILAQLSGQTGQTVTWNAYRNYTPETGGELVRLTLDAAGFLALYTGGAMAHKAAKMEEGGQRKAALPDGEAV